MADISYPYSFASGDVTSAPKVTGNLFKAASPDNTLDVLNGGLDGANVQPLVVRTQTQHGAFTVSGMVGGTVSLDYMRPFFRGVTDFAANGLNDPNTSFLEIPGLAATFFLPWNAKFVYLSWQVMWKANTYYANQLPEEAPIKLWYGGSSVSPQRRYVPITILSGVNFEPRRIRYWCGHHLTTSGGDCARGWHSAGLRICHNILSNDQSRVGPGQARVHARSLRWLAVR